MKGLIKYFIYALALTWIGYNSIQAVQPFKSAYQQKLEQVDQLTK